MRILYVSQYFPPEMGAPAARVYELSRHWVAAGHRVTVLTGFPNHPTGVVPERYRRAMRRMTLRESVDGIDVVRTWLYPAPNRRPWERILNYTSFFASAAVRGLALPRPDVVIATSPQLLVGLAGWWLARVKRCPFVFEVRDLWPESIVASGVGQDTSGFIRALRRLAAFLYRRATRIVVVTEAFKAELTMRWGIPEDRIDVIVNGVETDQFAPRADRDAVRQRLGLDGHFVAAYIGTLGYAHGLEAVLRAAERVRATGQRAVLFLLVGEGADKERLQEIAAQARLDNVRFMDQQPRELVPALINAADVCLVLLRRAPLFSTVLPSKMLEFMACGRPVVLGVDGYARALLERAEAGVFVEPGNVEALAAAVAQLARNPERCERLGANGRRFVVNYFSRAATAERYLQVLERLTSNPGIERPAVAGSPGHSRAAAREVQAAGLRSPGSGVQVRSPRARREERPAAAAPCAFRPPGGLDAGAPRARLVRALAKRALDVVLSALGLLGSAPLGLLIALAIKLEDGGPVFYAQERVGKGGQRFRSWKFRSMVPDSDQRFGPLQAGENDHRVTKVGRLLRATAMDELPQLWNIFKGDMSFVGPRALLPEEIEVRGNGQAIPLEKIPGYEERHRVRPGLTGLAQVYAPRDIPRRHKFKYDLLYIKKQSFWLDLKLIVLSFWITGRGKWEHRGKKF